MNEDNNGLRKEGLAKWRESGGKSQSRSDKFKVNPTRKLAIEIFCIQCLGGEDEPGIRNHVKNCCCTQCPLYQYRPFKLRGE